MKNVGCVGACVRVPKFARAGLDEGGSAVLLALVLSGFIGALGASLLLNTAVERMVAANTRERHDLALAAEAALDLVRGELAAYDTWNAALGGAWAASWADGAPSGARVLMDGTRLDLDELTALATCGRPACLEAHIVARTAERPWGPRNPRWRLVAWGRAAAAVRGAWTADPYLVVLIADDPADADPDPWRDAPEGTSGHGQVLLRAEAVGWRGARATIEALVRHDCAGIADAPCVQGSRVQSWRPVP